MDTEVRWLSKRNALGHLAKMWLMVLGIVQSLKTQACSKKQSDKAKALYKRRFQDTTTWVAGVVHVDVLSQQDIDPFVNVELLKVQENNALMGRIKR